jgi:hypothetical protein
MKVDLEVMEAAVVISQEEVTATDLELNVEEEEAVMGHQ